MKGFLFWLYLLNALMLIIHEIDSAYWKEWKLFRLPGGEGGFLLLHFPLLLPLLYGLVLVEQGVLAGLILSLLLSLSGIFAFSIHTYFIRRGREEFRTAVSQFILWSALLLSLAQLSVTLVILASG